jgi:hypothetical protein
MHSKNLIQNYINSMKISTYMTDGEETYQQLRTRFERNVLLDAQTRRDYCAYAGSFTELQSCHNDYVAGLNADLEACAKLVHTEHTPLQPATVRLTAPPLEERLPTVHFRRRRIPLSD